ncbi:MAG TPA: rhodanese-related sulfurtransferase [Candidatus Paceibacterota bacterium]|jgi:UPF0176 protein|nr:rhodanese-related sulfurtransferase [Candidatus Paceibacterota bacterium]
MAYQVLLFYKYVTIEDPKALADAVRALAQTHALLGRALIAEEGINATFEGAHDDTEAFLQEFLQDERFADMPVKRSASDGAAFAKLAVRVRDQIVGTKFPKEKADPRVKTAPRITPEELRRWFEEGEDFTIVDMRNDYEYKSGHFKGSVNPELENSRDLPLAIPKLEPLKKKKVLTVCTGGVRCESMSAYLMSEGFEDVYQLENGMHGYMEKYPGQDFLGTLYTFDRRKTMDFGGPREIVGRCVRCDTLAETYVNCANDFCHLHFIACEDCQTTEGTFCGTCG